MVNLSKKIGLEHSSSITLDEIFCALQNNLSEKELFDFTFMLFDEISDVNFVGQLLKKLGENLKNLV
jgi:hypothetical protein